MNLGNTEKSLLKEIAGLEAIPAGAYNVRENGKLAGRNVTAHIDIVTKKDKPATKKRSKSILKNCLKSIPTVPRFSIGKCPFCAISVIRKKRLRFRIKLCGLPPTTRIVRIFADCSCTI